MDNAIWAATNPERRRLVFGEPVATAPPRRTAASRLVAVNVEEPPQTTPISRVRTRPVRMTGRSMATPSRRGMMLTAEAVNRRRPAQAAARPRNRPQRANARPSTRAARTSRALLDPRAIRTPNSRLRTTERPMRRVTVFAHETTSTSRAAAIDTWTTGRALPSRVSSTDLTAALQASPLISRATRSASSPAWAMVVPSGMRPTRRYPPEPSGTTSHTSTSADGNAKSSPMTAATS